MTATLGALFITGLTVGMGYCVFACAPVVALYVAGTTDGWRAGLRATLAFSLARVSAYTLLGALAGGIGMSLVTNLQEEAFASWVQLGAAAFVILLGALIAIGHHPHMHLCHYLSRHTVQKSTLSMALLGFLIGIVPYCAPFLGILTYIAFALGDIPLGAMCGLAFGLGAALVTPLLVVGPAAGLLPRLFKTPVLLQIFRHASGGILLLFGIRMVLTTVM